MSCVVPGVLSSELRSHPLSLGDAAGRLFVRGAELYRGIRAPWADFYRGLLDARVVQALVDQGLLVDTWEAPDLAVEGFALVVHHRAVPAPSYPQEWCDAMFKDAALLTVRLLTALAPHGLTLRDANPWNVMFDYARPLHVDLPSIVPLGPRAAWSPRDEFERFVLRPLRLMERGHGRLARALLVSYEGVGPDDLEGALGRSAATRWRGALRRLARLRARALREHARARYDRDLRRLQREVESVRLPLAPRRVPPVPGGPRSDDDASLASLLEARRPATVLVAGPACTGQALLASRLGAGVVVLDPRPAVVTELFVLARTAGLRILPLLVDFTDPPPGRGIANHWSIPGTERLRSEAVVAIGLVEELVRRRQLGFDHVAEGVAQFSARWAVVDFAEPGRGDADAAPLPAGYRLDRLREALGRRFRHVSVVPAASSCHLLVCEK